jgi:hypothetical protein
LFLNGRLAHSTIPWNCQLGKAVQTFLVANVSDGALPRRHIHSQISVFSPQKVQVIGHHPLS